MSTLKPILLTLIILTLCLLLATQPLYTIAMLIFSAGIAAAFYADFTLHR